MRISGGEAKGIPLLVPKKSSLRPASETARERLFSSLGNLVPGASFHDLFAGTGSYGLEAASRGAAKGTFIEKDARTANCLRSNLKEVCKSARIEVGDFSVLEGDAMRVIPPTEEPFDLVFADPPYPILQKIADRLFARLMDEDLAGANTRLILELPGEIELSPQGWVLERRLGKRRKGSPHHALFRIA